MWAVWIFWPEVLTLIEGQPLSNQDEISECCSWGIGAHIQRPDRQSRFSIVLSYPPCSGEFISCYPLFEVKYIVDCWWIIFRGATEYGLSADIRIRIRLQSGYRYHFFTSVNIRIRIRKVGADTDMVKVISYSYPIRYPDVACFIMISVWRRLFFNGIRY